MVYNPAKDSFLILRAQVNRRAQSFEMEMVMEHLGDSANCYMSFASVDGKLHGDSWHVGEVLVI